MSLSVLQEHWSTIADTVNAKQHAVAPKDFKTCYQPAHCKQKLRNLKRKYTEENNRRKRMYANGHGWPHDPFQTNA